MWYQDQVLAGRSHCTVGTLQYSITDTWLPVNLVVPFPSLKLPSQKKTETKMSLKTRVKQSEVWEYGFSEDLCFLWPERHINHSKAYSDLWFAIFTGEWFPMKAPHGEGQQAVQLWRPDKSKMVLSHHPNVLTVTAPNPSWIKCLRGLMTFKAHSKSLQLF